MMHWLFPGFLAGAAAIGLPILLHLLRRWPRRTVMFPSLRFLGAAPVQNARSQRIRRLIVLLLRCLAILLLACAFARPFLQSAADGPHRVMAVVVDNSFSLQAGRRWPVLRQWAREQIASKAAGDNVGIVLLAPRPTWIVPLTATRDTALAQLDRLEPGWDMVRAESGLRVAADALAGAVADRRELLFLTDHQEVTWNGFNFNRSLPTGVVASFPPAAGDLSRQAALGAPSVRRTPTGFHLRVPVRNYTGPQSRVLQVFRDGALLPVARQKLDLAERESRIAEFDLSAPATSVAAAFRFALDADDLPADDVAYAVSQPGGDRTVLLDPLPADAVADYLATALNATADMKPAVHVATTSGGAWPPNAVAVLRHDGSFTGEAGTRLTSHLRAGGTALVFMTGGPAQAAWLKNVAGVSIRTLAASGGPNDVHDWTMDHPLVSAVGARNAASLVGWQFRRGWALPVESVEPLALWSTDSVALGEIVVGAGKLLLCGFTADRVDGDWPVREMFVPFVHRSVSYLLGGESGETAKPARVGQSIVLPNEGGRWEQIDGPAHPAAPITVSTMVTPDRPGVYALTHGGQRQLFAVNLAAEESDPTPWRDGNPWEKLNAPPSAARTNRPALFAGSAESEQRRSLWWWPVAGMAVAILLELGIANRTSR